jgi:hypothetical protein
MNPIQTMTNETTLAGGAIRVSHFTAPDVIEQGPHEAGRVHAGVHRYAFSSQELESVGVTKYSHSTAGQVGGSVAATLDRTGHCATVELIPGNPASRTDVALALREGLLVRDASGNLVDAHGVQQLVEGVLPVEEAPQQGTDPGAAVFDAGDDANWGADIEPLPQHAYDSAVASVIAVTAHDVGSLEDTGKALAENAGIEPHLADEYVREGVAMYERTVARALGQMGLEGEALQRCYDYMRAKPAQLQDAIQRLVHMRDASGFVALAGDFNVQRPRDLSALHSAGFQTAIDRTTGEVMVQREGGNWVRLSELTAHSSVLAGYGVR